MTLASFLPGQDGLSNILSFIPSGQAPVLQINVNNVGRLDFGVGKNFKSYEFYENVEVNLRSWYTNAVSGRAAQHRGQGCS